MTLREYAKLMNDTALQGSLSNEEYNRLYKPLLDGIQSMIPPKSAVSLIFMTVVKEKGIC